MPSFTTGSASNGFISFPHKLRSGEKIATNQVSKKDPNEEKNKKVLLKKNLKKPKNKDIVYNHARKDSKLYELNEEQMQEQEVKEDEIKTD